MQTPFEILGLSNDAGVEEAKKRYRKLAQFYHPDRNKSAEAEGHFKKVKAAWELIESGWELPKPKEDPTAPHTYTYDAKKYAKAFTVKATFKDVFTNQPMVIPGTAYTAVAPYGVRPGSTVRQQVKGPDGHHDVFDITWDVYDPNNFYRVQWVEELYEDSPFMIKRMRKVPLQKHMLCCTVKVTAGQLLGAVPVTLPNINPQAGTFKVTLEAASPIKVPRAGLMKSNNPLDGRDDLYVYLDINYKDLKDERYDVLLELQKQIERALSEKHKSSALNT